MSAALDELLDAARLVTLEHWCDFAVDAQLTAPLFSVARAEVMLRRGCHIEAIATLISAKREESSLAYRAISIAGRAAHLASREEEALEFSGGRSRLRPRMTNGVMRFGVSWHG